MRRSHPHETHQLPHPHSDTTSIAFPTPHMQPIGVAVQSGGAELGQSPKLSCNACQNTLGPLKLPVLGLCPAALQPYEAALVLIDLMNNILAAAAPPFCCMCRPLLCSQLPRVGWRLCCILLRHDPQLLHQHAAGPLPHAERAPQHPLQGPGTIRIWCAMFYCACRLAAGSVAQSQQHTVQSSGALLLERVLSCCASAACI